MNYHEISLTIDRHKEIAEVSPTIVSQGQTFDSNEELFAAAHAVDGYFSTRAVTDAAKGGGWLKLQLEKSFFVHKVVIYWRFYTNWYHSNWCTESEHNFKLCFDIESNVDVSVYQGEVKQKSCGTLQLTYGLEQSDQIYTLLCNTRGDTVKLSKDTGQIAVLEVAVTNTGSPYKSTCSIFIRSKYLIF